MNNDRNFDPRPRGGYRGNNYNSNYNPYNNRNTPPQREYTEQSFKKYDMVRVVDFNSPLLGKYGLIADVQEDNPRFQIIVNIGRYYNKMRMEQVRFCTRVYDKVEREDDDRDSYDRREAKENSHDIPERRGEVFIKKTISVPKMVYTPPPVAKVNDYIDELKEEDVPVEIERRDEGMSDVDEVEEVLQEIDKENDNEKESIENYDDGYSKEEDEEDEKGNR